MKVSIIIPAHNEEKSIEPSIKAALAQDYQDFEVIVVDNASTDKTALVVGKYPVKLVQESRKGLLWAREAGRRVAAGEVIANMDADCLPEQNWLSRGVKYFVDSKVVGVTGPYFYYDAKPWFRNVSHWMQKSFYKLFSFFLPMLIGGNNLIRAKSLEDVGGYNTRITFYGEDTDTAMRIRRVGKIKFINSLSMSTSGRRFEEEGVFHLWGKYLAFFFKTLWQRD